MDRVSQTLRNVNDVAQSEEFEQFMMNAQDFLSQRDTGGNASTKIAQAMTTLDDAAQVLNRSMAQQQQVKTGVMRRDGSEQEVTEDINVINPVVLPRPHRSWGWVFLALTTAVFAILARLGLGFLDITLDAARVFFGWHFWIFWAAYVVFHVWRNSYVMIPDGCRALITIFGRVDKEVDAGHHFIFHPWKQVGYIVNTTKEYPYNAPIRQAPTQEQVNASIDLFLQFRINDPREFIFRLGGVNGFQEKLQNAISEQTRALIYSQRAEEIYDLVGESTSTLLVNLNEQFMPAVEFVNVNITHAEPSDQGYRMDLAAAEMVRVAKEAYTYEYELDLRKKRDEGDLDQELAGLKETLSGIRAEIATFEAQIGTAHEKEINRANAYANQLMIEAESEAEANAALFQAQALDIRALQSAYYPEILEYRYAQDILNKIHGSADKLPQLINIGADKNDTIDFMALARQMMGIEEKPLYTESELEQIRTKVKEMSTRIRNRDKQIKEVTTIDADDLAPVEEVLS